MTNVIELKIKNKHLAEEARIIRLEEKKLKKHTRANIEYHKACGHNGEYPFWKDHALITRHSLEAHRKVDVRNEQRATYLARAFIEGKKCPESNVKDKDRLNYYILPRVVTMVKKYSRGFGGLSDQEWRKKINDWMAESQKNV